MKVEKQFKEVEIGERKFIIKKFNALVGSFMLFKVISIITPMLDGISIGKLTEMAKADTLPEMMKEGDQALNFSKIFSGLSKLSEQEFKDIQTKCLGVCFEYLPGGEVCIINQEGNFAVQDLDTNTAVIMALTVHALIFNAQGFFEGSPLAYLMTGK